MVSPPASDELRPRVSEECSNLRSRLNNKNGVGNKDIDIKKSADTKKSVEAAKGSTCPVAEFRVPAKYQSHPGGQDPLKFAPGANAPGILFLSYHMGCDLDGKIASAAQAMNCPLPERGPIYDEMHEAIRQIKLRHPYQHTIWVLWCVLLTVGILATFGFWMLWPSLYNSLAASIFFECYFLNIFHARHHKGGKLYDIPLLDRLTSPLYDIIDRTWGYVPSAWHINHNVRHHLHTNDLEIDPDLPDTFPLVRISEDQPKYWYYKFQTFYWPLLLPFSVTRFPLQNVVKYNGGMPVFVLWLTLMFGLPGVLHGYSGLALSILIQGATGVLITSKFSVSHCHSHLGSEDTGTGNDWKCMDKWIKSQVEESISWGGYISCLIYGGIGYQIEHHVCPALDPPLYYFVQPELKRICQKHGIRFTTEPSFFHATYQFHRKLWNMGK